MSSNAAQPPPRPPGPAAQTPPLAPAQQSQLQSQQPQLQHAVPRPLPQQGPPQQPHRALHMALPMRPYAHLPAHHAQPAVPGPPGNHTAVHQHHRAQPPLQPGQVRLRARAETVYSAEWSAEEQDVLDSALDKFPASSHTPLERYVRIAATLPKKGVRDVALRVKWLASSQAAHKRKIAEDANAKKQVRRERNQSIFAVKPSAGAPLQPAAPLQPMAPPPLAMFPPPPMQAPIMPVLDDHGAASVGVVSGPVAQLLEQNYAILNQFKQNMAQYKVNENTELLVRYRDNILTILNQMNSMTGVMQHMPPLPVRLNVELANNFLPKAGSGNLFPQGVLQSMASGFMVQPHKGGGMPLGTLATAPMTTSGSLKRSGKGDGRANGRMGNGSGSGGSRPRSSSRTAVKQEAEDSAGGLETRTRVTRSSKAAM